MVVFVGLDVVVFAWWLLVKRNEKTQATAAPTTPAPAPTHDHSTQPHAPFNPGLWLSPNVAGVLGRKIQMGHTGQGSGVSDKPGVFHSGGGKTFTEADVKKLEAIAASDPELVANVMSAVGYTD